VGPPVRRDPANFVRQGSRRVRSRLGCVAERGRAITCRARGRSKRDTNPPVRASAGGGHDASPRSTPPAQIVRLVHPNSNGEPWRGGGAIRGGDSSALVAGRYVRHRSVGRLRRGAAAARLSSHQTVLPSIRGSTPQLLGTGVHYCVRDQFRSNKLDITDLIDHLPSSVRSYAGSASRRCRSTQFW
jgi:hypothetical protein